MARILIVDDQLPNREILRAYLEPAGHELFEADGGVSAIEAFERHDPDLVLLDVMMPHKNGFEVTEHIKAYAGEVFVPVILVSALNDPTSRIIGLRAGADEFLSKPVDKHELSVRVRNLLSLRAKDRALAKRNIEQVELHRFKDEMVAMIVHDLKNPLSVITASVHYVLEHAPELDGEAREATEEAQAAAQRMLRLLANLTDVARAESTRLELERERTSPEDLIAPLIAQRTSLAELRGIEIESRLDGGCDVEADGDMLARVLENLLDNACRHAPRGGKVQVTATRQGPRVVIRVGNTGSAIPAAARPHIFEKYARAGGPGGRMNLGLGLYFCRLAVEAHAGTISVDETAELATVFIIDLPLAGSSRE